MLLEDIILIPARVCFDLGRIVCRTREIMFNLNHSLVQQLLPQSACTRARNICRWTARRMMATEPMPVCVNNADWLAVWLIDVWVSNCVRISSLPTHFFPGKYIMPADLPDDISSNNQRVMPCSVCQRPVSTPSGMMIPGKTVCPTVRGGV